MNKINIKEKIDIRFSTEDGKVKSNSDKDGQFEAEFVFRANSNGSENHLNLNEKHPEIHLINLADKEKYQLYDATIEVFDNDDIKIIGKCGVYSRGSTQPLNLW